MKEIKNISLILIYILLYLLSNKAAGNNPFSFQDTRDSISHKNNTLIPMVEDISFSYDATATFTVIYKEGEGFIAINRDNEPLFKIFPFDNGPDYPSEGLFRIIKKDLIGFANLKGEIVIKPNFSAVYPFHGGLAAFCNNCITVNQGEHKSWQEGKWGFIDKTGSIIIPAQYDRVIRDFGQDNAVVELNSIQIIIDKKGNQVKTP